MPPQNEAQTPYFCMGTNGFENAAAALLLAIIAFYFLSSLRYA